MILEKLMNVFGLTLANMNTFKPSNRIGPGVRNHLKNMRGYVKSNVETTDRRGEDLKGGPRKVTTFTSVPTGTIPHQGKREVARRLRQEARKVA